MDNITRAPSSTDHQWMPLIYHLHDHASEGQPASELIMTGGTTDTILSPSNSSVPLTTPKGSSRSATTGSKSIRRRSRASKKTPTTLLNANAGNFRSLVQHYTGCPSPAAGANISFGNLKGPVNLEFGRAGSSEVENQRIIASVLNMAPFGNNNYHYVQQYSDYDHQSQGQHRPVDQYNKRRHDQQQEQQQLLQEQQSMYSFSNNISGDVFVSASSNVVHRPNVGNSEGFARLDEDNISFHELAMNSFSSDFENIHDGFF